MIASSPRSTKQKGAGRILPGSGLSAPIAPVTCHHVGKRSWLEVQVPLDRQTKRAASTLQLGEHEVAPFVVHAAHESEETEIAVFFGTFRDVPGPLRIRREEFGMLCGPHGYVALRRLALPLPAIPRDGRSLSSQHKFQPANVVALLERRHYPLFETLYRRQFTVRLQRAAAFAEERRRYLQHLAQHGYARATIRAAARDILAVAEQINLSPPRKVTIEIVEGAVTKWMQSTQRTSRATRTRVVNNGKAWLRFLDLFAERERIHPFAAELEHFTRYMRDERGLAAATIESRLATLNGFLSWVQRLRPSFSGIELTDVDQYLAGRGRETWSRRTVATNAQTLRTFFRYAEQHHWCRPGIANGIELPRVYRQENLPLGPTWDQVKALLAATAGDSARDLRDRAALLLFAVYGLRCSEVRQLRLEDIDWDRETMTVRRAKCRKTHTLPLTREVGDAIIRYIREARPKCVCREIFTTLKAPWRSLSQAGFYDGVRDRLDRLGIDLARRGPHSLRHACATKLLAEGFSLKEIGDCLGHATTEATSVYAKVDLAGLKAVADFDFGGLR